MLDEFPCGTWSVVLGDAGVFDLETAAEPPGRAMNPLIVPDGCRGTMRPVELQRDNRSRQGAGTVLLVCRYIEWGGLKATSSAWMTVSPSWGGTR